MVGPSNKVKISNKYILLDLLWKKIWKIFVKEMDFDFRVIDLPTYKVLILEVYLNKQKYFASISIINTNTLFWPNSKMYNLVNGT